MQKKVLIVDDEPTVRKELAYILEDVHTVASVDVASDGKVALEKITSQDFNVLITDINMPNMTGFDLLKRLKLQKEECIPHYRIVITSKQEVTLLQRALEIGCFHYISEPRDTQVLEIFDRMDWQYPITFTPRVWAIMGPKCVGKSEALCFGLNYIPGFERVVKYSSRNRRQSDLITGDTRHLTEMPEDQRVEDNIHWNSHGNTNCVLVNDVQDVLDSGHDCGIAMAHYDGYESLMEYFPNAKVIVLDSEPQLIKKILYNRRDDRVPLEEILDVRNTFARHFAGSRWTNVDFFNIADKLSREVYRSRTGEYP
jgi:CheY-like chemotaxis protein